MRFAAAVALSAFGGDRGAQHAEEFVRRPARQAAERAEAAKKKAEELAAKKADEKTRVAAKQAEEKARKAEEVAAAQAAAAQAAVGGPLPNLPGHKGSKMRCWSRTQTGQFQSSAEAVAAWSTTRSGAFWIGSGASHRPTTISCPS